MAWSMTGSAVKVSSTDASRPARIPAMTAPMRTGSGRDGSKRFHMADDLPVGRPGRRLVAGDAEEVAPVVEQLVEEHARAGHLGGQEAVVEGDRVERGQGERQGQPCPGGDL